MKYIIMVFLLISVFFLNAVMGQQTFTDRDRGEEYREFQDIIATDIKPDYSFNSADSRLGISWQTSDPTAIANGVCVSAKELPYITTQLFPSGNIRSGI